MMVSMSEITFEQNFEKNFIIFCHAIGFTFANEGTSVSIFSKNIKNR